MVWYGPAHPVRQRRASGCLGSLCLMCSFGADPDDVKRIGKFVSHFHPPILTGLKLAIKALQQPSCSDCRFVPCRVLVRQLLSHRIRLGAFVEDIKKISWHRVQIGSAKVWFPRIGEFAGIRRVKSAFLGDPLTELFARK